MRKMKRGWFLFLGLAIFSACNNTATLEKKADSISNKIETFGKKVLDSGKKDMKNLKNKIHDQFFQKDSAKNEAF